MKRFLLFAVALAGLSSGCSFLSDLMNMQAPRIISYSPASAQVDASLISDVRIKFSNPMEKTATEGAFLLTEDNGQLEGRFSWQNNTMIFLPFAGFKANKRYTMSLSSSSEDIHGNSLQEEFTFSFFTGAEIIPPWIVDHQPDNGTTVTDLREPVVIQFSESIDQESLYKSFSISPDITGSFLLSPDQTTATFTPITDYEAGREYRVEIGTDLTDLSGNSLPKEFYFYFTAGEKMEQEVLSIQTSDGSMSLVDTEIEVLNEGLEKDAVFEIQFKYPVELEQISGIVEMIPSASHELAWSGDYTLCTLSFPDYLEWNRVYELKILERTYRIRISGQESEPPEVERLTFCKATGTSGFIELKLNDPLDFIKGEAACFDFYIHHAQSFDIDLASFSEALSITASNDCVSVSLLYLKRSPFLSADPDPELPPEANTTVMRIYCEITDNESSGTLSLTLDTKLKDTNENHLLEQYTMTVNK